MAESSWIGGDLNPRDRNDNGRRFQPQALDEQSDLRDLVTETADTAVRRPRWSMPADLPLELGHIRCLVARNELTTVAANELNQRLAAIILHCGACLRSLNQDQLQPDKISACVSSILQDSLQSADVIRQLRMLAMKFDFPTAELDINRIIRETVPFIRSEAFDAGLNLRFDLQAKLPAVTGDRILLQQVIIELLINSIRATMSVRDRPREIVVRSHLSGVDRVAVVVQSNGTYFEPSEMQRALDAPYASNAGGLGTGLSICRSIVEAHRGRIWASCDSADGAAFHLSLPAKRDNAKIAKQNPRCTELAQVVTR
jgi:signal transduction histidine kinase